MDKADETETLTAVVRRILKREIDTLETLSANNQMPVEGIDRLAKCALILQRIRRNDPEGGAGSEASDESLMRKAM